MSEKIKVKAPAKINFNLKVGKKRHDGFHPINSFMQSISLCDFITVEKTGMGITLNGTSDEIPYDEGNLAYKAAALFFNETRSDLKKTGVNIYIEKNIPVCAGLAGGSTDASAVLFALNKLNSDILTKETLDNLCAKLGSDLNFCLTGGSKICKGRGEILVDTEFKEIPITLVKPQLLKISAKEAYQRFDELTETSNLENDLEFALLPHYEEIKKLNRLNFQMSGSGPCFFACQAFLDENLKNELQKDHLIIENLRTIPHGVIEIH